MMRELSDKHKLSVRSVGEINDIAQTIASRLAVTGRVVYRGRKMKKESVVNAMLLYMDSLPAQVQDHALEQGIKRLERILAMEPEEALAYLKAERERRERQEEMDITDQVSQRPEKTAKRSALGPRKRGSA